MAEEDKDEEISFDLNKIKNFFRKKKKDLSEIKEEVKSKIQGIKKEIKQEEKELSEEINKAEEKKQEAKEVIKEFKEEEQDINKTEQELKQGKLEEAENDVKDILKEVKKTEEKADEIMLSVDFKQLADKTLDFFKKNKFVIPIICIIIAMFFSVHFRMQSAYLPLTDQWAEDTMYDFLKGQIKADIDKQYPNLPEVNKQTLVNNQFKEALKTQKKDIDNQIKEISDQYKKHFQDDNGYTYLLAIDPYYYLRHARNYLSYGIAGTKLVGGQEDWTDQILMYPTTDFSEKMSWDGQRMAPIGSINRMTFHSYAIVYLYKIMHFFNDKINLMRAAFFIPILFSALSVIPAFFLGKKVSGNLGGFFASFMIGIHGAFINRTAGGFSDTDAYNVFFPLLIAWIFFEAFDTKDIKKKIGLSALTGFLIVLYSTAWSGWWYIAGFVFATLGIYFIYLAVTNLNLLKRNFKGFLKQNAVKNTLIVAGSVLAAFIIVALIFDASLITNLILKPIKFTQIKAVATTTIWPNIQTTVAELNPASLTATLNQIGGKFLFLIAVIGIVLTFIKKEETKTHIKYGILLTIWFLATIYASTKGLRFILLLVPAFSIAFGVFCGIVYNHLTKWMQKEIHIEKNLAGVIIAVVLALLLISPIKAGYAVSVREVPSMNDAWYTSLNKIREQSAPDAIINSWWDFGHWFITITNRSVTFDGAGQDRHMAHWIGKSILTNDEDTAIGILRMVDCGNNNAFYALNGVEALEKDWKNIIDETGVLNDTPLAIDILNRIILMNKENAKQELLKYVPEKRADLVLEYTHCDPPENYYITSEDMIGKSGVWAHFGSWDFNKAMIYNTLKKKEYRNDREKSIEFLKQRFDYSEEQADQMYYDVQAITTDREANDWIAPWPSYTGISNCRVDDDLVTCGNGAQINISSYDAVIRVNQGTIKPSSIVYVRNNDLVEKEFEGKTAQYTVALIQKENSYRSVIMDPALAKSTFTRLFFFEGVGSRYFELFSYEKGITGTEIYVWKVNWQGKPRSKKVEVEIPMDFSENKTETNQTNST